MRLGDLDALKTKIEINFSRKPEAQAIFKHLIDIIDDAPTVIIDWEKSDAYLDCVKRIKSLEKENDELRQFLKKHFERPQGEWIKDNSGDRFCSECGSSALYHEIGLIIESRFCPNCGAQMVGGTK